MKRRVLLLLTVCGSLSAAAAAAARAQDGVTPPPAPSAAERGAELRVFLMTLSPGSIIYERFGHNTIAIHDPSPPAERVEQRDAFERRIGGELKPAPPFNRTDRAYHYGAFDFEQEGFVPRFIMGRMEYWTTSEWADLTVLTYAADGRGVLLQELNLTPAQKLELQRHLERSVLPENRFYRYDYYRDNCSTRVRDAIDHATGGQLQRQLRATPTGTTYRSHTRRLTSGLDPLDLFWFTAFTYVLGHPVDEPLSGWEESFLPDNLAKHVRGVTLADPAGGGGGLARPLVLSEQVVASATRAPMPEHAPRRTPGYVVAGLLAGGAFYGLARVAGRSRAGRIGFTLLVVPWTLMWGVGAAIGTWGWAFTDHAASYRNENLLQFGVLVLPLAILAPALAFGRRRGGRVAVALALAGAAMSVLGMLLQVLPAFWQHNAEIIAIAVPANIGLLAATWLLAKRAGAVGGPTPAPTPAPAGKLKGG